MLTLAITLLALGLLLVALSVRGRVVARGRFCRRCRFDLAGLGPDRDACPECGRSLSAPRAARPALRRISRPGLVLGVVLLLIGAAGIWLSAFNNAAAVLQGLPDRPLLALHALGVDDAFDEIVANRLQRVPPLDDRAWIGLIDDALAARADEQTPWDPRHGQVLMVAWADGRLTPAQVDRYLADSLAISVEFAGPVRHGAEQVGMRLIARPSERIASVTGSEGVVTLPAGRMMIQYEITETGMAGRPAPPARRVGMTGFDVPAAGFPSRGMFGSIVRLTPDHWAGVEPGTEQVFFVEYEAAIVDMEDDRAFYRTTGRIEQHVRVLPADAELVARVAPPETLAAFETRPVLRIAPIYTRGLDGEGADPGSVRFGIIAHDLPVAVVGDVVVIHDGRETRVGVFSAPASIGYHIGGQGWTDPPPDAADLLAAWAAAGTVTVEIRPNARQAEKVPGVDTILGVPLRFEGVRVRDDQPAPNVLSSAENPEHIPGRPVRDADNQPGPDPDPGQSPTPSPTPSGGAP